MKKNMLNPKLSAILMLASALFFFQDVVHDVRDHWQSHMSYQGTELLHITFEIVAVISLVIGIFEVLNKVRYLEIEKLRQTNQLKHLREDFDELVHRKFSNWGLSPAERDVALMMLRGLTVEQISEIRDVSKGTIKVQSHKIMQKADVGSRVEFMSIFLDDFIDVGINQAIYDSETTFN